MRTNCLVVLLACLSLLSCSKEANDLTITEEATVFAVKYPCGPSCTGSAWTIQTISGEAYEPTNLPLHFESNELPVKLTFTKTGHRSAPNAGTGNEFIRIETITRR